ncbi:hypothetical protein VCHA43P273_390007 [Vibrio chagasii]|nr:hypothetical protein VCHA43P273_390007 [Vibrio chagasii]
MLHLIICFKFGFVEFQIRVLGVRISPPLPYTKPQQKCWGFFTSVASAKQCWELERQPGRISGVSAHPYYI